MFRFAFLSFCLLNLCTGFTPTSVRNNAIARSLRTQVASTVANSLGDHDDDYLRFRQMMTQARECAFSDSGSAVDARRFLREILRLESGCVSGSLSGDICDNIDEVAELVAHLRVKAKQGAVEVAAAPAFTGVLASTVLVMMFAILLTTVDLGRGTTPYTFDEWIWAAQGGYLNNMVEHFLRNGGL